MRMMPLPPRTCGCCWWIVLRRMLEMTKVKRMRAVTGMTKPEPVPRDAEPLGGDQQLNSDEFAAQLPRLQLPQLWHHPS